MMDKIHLTGFHIPEEELIRLHKVFERYLKKIGEQIQFENLEVNLKKSIKGKAYYHEIRGHLKTGGKILSAEATDFNIYKAVSSVLNKILHEAQHMKRTARQRV